MDVFQFSLALFTFLISVTFCDAGCDLSNGLYNNLLSCSAVFWDTGRIVGAVIGSLIGVVVIVVVFIVLCRICRTRQVIPGAINSAPMVTTVTNQQQQCNMAYYPQNQQYGQPIGMAGYNYGQPGQQPMAAPSNGQHIGTAGYNYGQPGQQPMAGLSSGQPIGITGYNYFQPGQQPVAGCNNAANDPPPYNQIDFQTKT